MSTFGSILSFLATKSDVNSTHILLCTVRLESSTAGIRGKKNKVKPDKVDWRPGEPAGWLLFWWAEDSNVVKRWIRSGSMTLSDLHVWGFLKIGHDSHLYRGGKDESSGLPQINCFLFKKKKKFCIKENHKKKLYVFFFQCNLKCTLEEKEWHVVWTHSKCVESDHKPGILRMHLWVQAQSFYMYMLCYQ